MAKAISISRGKKDTSNIYVLLKSKAVYILERDGSVYDAAAVELAKEVHRLIAAAGVAEINARSKAWRKVR